MSPLRLDRALFCLLLAIAVGCIACQRHRSEPDTGANESYDPATGAVGFDVIRLGSSDGSPRWLATYTDGVRTTKFSIELGPASSSDDPSSPRVGKGRLAAETDSDPLPLLDSLKKALQAKRMPSGVQKADTLPFDYLLLGENQSRSLDGRFSQSPRGNWMATKIFLANDQAEVYFNLNPVIHKAEFSIKNPLTVTVCLRNSPRCSDFRAARLYQAAENTPSQLLNPGAKARTHLERLSGTLRLRSGQA
jgi:hypothetical protein